MKQQEAQKQAKITALSGFSDLGLSASPVIVLHLLKGQAESDYYLFGSLSALYRVFTPKQIGVSLKTLYRHKISRERPYLGSSCEVFKTDVYRLRWRIKNA